MVDLKIEKQNSFKNGCVQEVTCALILTFIDRSHFEKLNRFGSSFGFIFSILETLNSL